MKKYIIVINIVILVIGLIIGFNNSLDLSNITNLSINYYFFIFNILIYLIAILLVFIGIPFYYLIMLYDVISYGIVMGILICNFNLFGLFISLVFLLLKTILWFLLFLNGYYSLKYIKNKINYLLNRLRVNKLNKKLYLKKMIIINIITIIYTFICTLIYFNISNLLI